MAAHFDIGPYDPCPCGSGEKYKFCCAAKAKANRHGKFPVGTVAHYGPDDRRTTKIAAGVILREGEGPAFLERWVSDDVATSARVAEEIKGFFARHGVKSVVVTDGNLGCPHEEGKDFPTGRDCPFCPFWAGKQGTARRDYDDEADRDPFDEYGEDESEEDESEEDDLLAANEDDDGEEGFVTPEEADASFERVEAILGDKDGDEDLDMDKAFDVLCSHLAASLQLPCEVTGTEDFQWEEPYVVGGFHPADYRELKKTRPSYRDRYELIGISREGSDEWLMFREDLRAHVRRISDGKKFALGLSELEPTDKHSPNYQLMRDYSIWFVNSR
jgi:hypothetical protein